MQRTEADEAFARGCCETVHIGGRHTESRRSVLAEVQIRPESGVTSDAATWH